MDVTRDKAIRRIGCVGYLNARPLVDGLGRRDGVDVIDAVPSALLAMLEDDTVDVALCPVIDYQTSDTELVVLPVGAIGCDGPTMTVRLFSRVPLDRITSVATDTDSHTSRVLVRVVLEKMLGRAVPVVDFAATDRHDRSALPETVLLIGDKVVAQAPPADDYPHTLDLGGAWRRLTGLPFVFAVWMAKAGRDLGDLPTLLDQTRRRNADRIPEIAAQYAPEAGWSFGLADQYLGSLLHYEVASEQLDAMQMFWRYAAQMGLIDGPRPLKLVALDPSGARCP